MSSPWDIAIERLETELHAAHERIAALEQELAHWKTCSLCGEPMDAPGHCSAGQTEEIQGLQQMHDETLTRAEQAEARCLALEQQNKRFQDGTLLGKHGREQADKDRRAHAGTRQMETTRGDVPTGSHR